MRTTLLCGALALLAGCSGDDGHAGDPGHVAAVDGAASRRVPVTPAICGTAHVRRTGSVRAPQAAELSGLARSRRHPGVLWAHNDSGDRPRVFALRDDGVVLGDLDVPGASAVDWEDIAVGPDPQGAGDALYIADIGDNARRRATVDVLRVPEPDALPAPPGTRTAPAVRLSLRYPDGAHDAEALLVDPRSAEMVIVTKDPSGRAGVYAARRPAAGSTTTLRRVTGLKLGVGAMVTGGDVSADGRVVALRTYARIVAWRKSPGASLATTLRRRPCRGQVDLTGEGQGEALALSAGGRAFSTVAEGVRPTLRRYVVAQP